MVRIVIDLNSTPQHLSVEFGQSDNFVLPEEPEEDPPEDEEKKPDPTDKEFPKWKSFKIKILSFPKKFKLSQWHPMWIANW